MSNERFVENRKLPAKYANLTVQEIEENAEFVGAATFNPADGYIYKGRAQALMDTGFIGAQMVLPSDITAIKAVVILEELLGLARPDYVLDGILRPVPAPQLVLHIDKASKTSVTRGVKPLEEAEITPMAFTGVDFTFVKNVGHVVVADESRMQAARNVLQIQIEDVARALAEARNLDIKDVAESAVVTAVTGADWGPKTGASSNNSPYDDIGPVVSTIRGLGMGPPDFIAMHDDVYADLVGNTFVRESVLAGMGNVPGDRLIIPGYPRLRLIIDYNLTNTIALVGNSRQWGMIAEGPVESAQYRDEKAGYNGFIIRDWHGVKEAFTTTVSPIRKLTGVHA